MATIVESERISWAVRRSGAPVLISLPPIVSPTPTVTLARTRAVVPAARLVIQKNVPELIRAPGRGAAQ